MKKCTLQLERLKVIASELENLQDGEGERTYRQQLAAFIADARIYLHEISMRCKTKHLRLVETTSNRLDQVRKETLDTDGSGALSDVLQAIQEFLDQTDLVLTAAEKS